MPAVQTSTLPTSAVRTKRRRSYTTTPKTSTFGNHATLGMLGLLVLALLASLGVIAANLAN